MENENEEVLNAALNTPSGQEPPKAEPEPEEIETVEVEPEEPEELGEPDDKPLSKSEQRFQKLANERADARARAEMAEKQAEFYRNQAETLQRERQKPEEEELDPDEKWRRDANARIQRTEFMAADMADKAAFLTKYSKNPEVLALVDEVETMLAKARAAGNNAPRENALKFLMGEKALERLSKAPAVKRLAAERVKAAQGTPLGAKSNVASSKSEPSLYDRLKDQSL